VVFNSLNFVVFFAVTYGLYLLLPHRWQNWMLLVASYYFYASWDWRFLSLLLISTVLDYTCALRIEASENPRVRKAWLALSVSGNLGMLGFFKYWGFFAQNLHRLLGSFGLDVPLPLLHVVLPVGISFYTFQTMSYALDVYRREMPATRSFSGFALNVAFFPHLVAGPIVRTSRLLPQVLNPRRITNERIYHGLWLILWGFFLKCFVADNLAPIADGVFGHSTPHEAGMVLVGVYAFAFQIFGDFAGYSSIAMGLANLMGFDLGINFRQPYLVTNPQDFWKHWHISLSTFLRDYLYVPLGGNRGSRWATYRNLTITMLLGGLWHGAAWNFVAWGAYHGTLLAGHRALTESRRKGADRPDPAGWRILKIVFMFHLTCLGWLLFRAHSLTQIGQFLGTLVYGSWTVTPAVRSGLLQIGSYIWLLMILQVVQARGNDVHAPMRLPEWARVTILVLAVESLLMAGAYGGKDFIYFQF